MRSIKFDDVYYYDVLERAFDFQDSKTENEDEPDIWNHGRQLISLGTWYWYGDKLAKGNLFISLK